MMRNYCWMLCRDDKRHSYTKIVFKAFLGNCVNLLNNKETLNVILYVGRRTQNTHWLCIELFMCCAGVYKRFNVTLKAIA